MPQFSAFSLRCCSRFPMATNPRSRVYSLAVTTRSVWAIAMLLLALCGWTYTATAQPTMRATSIPDGPGTVTGGKGRLYIFRMVRPFGADIDEEVTVNGKPVARVSSGHGFYCDVKPGDYVIGVSQHKTNPLRVSVTPGQGQYVCVMLQDREGSAPRQGAPTSNQAFDLRLLEPSFGAERIQQYHLTPANCQP
jgi:hypothetical protein